MWWSNQIEKKKSWGFWSVCTACLLTYSDVHSGTTWLSNPVLRASHLTLWYTNAKLDQTCWWLNTRQSKNANWSWIWGWDYRYHSESWTTTDRWPEHLSSAVWVRSGRKVEHVLSHPRSSLSHQPLPQQDTSDAAVQTAPAGRTVQQTYILEILTDSTQVLCWKVTSGVQT